MSANRRFVCLVAACSAAICLSTALPASARQTGENGRAGSDSEAATAPSKATGTASAHKGGTGTDTQQRLLGTWPKRMPKVSIDQEKGTVADALRSLAGKAGWGLMLAAPAGRKDRQIMVQVKRQPADVVLKVVLRQGDLQAKLEEGVLVVTPFKKGTKPAAGGVELPPGETENAFGAEIEAEAAGGDAKGADAQVKVERGAGDGAEAGKRRGDAAEQKTDKKQKEGTGRAGPKEGRRGRQDRVVVGSSLRIEKQEEVDSAVAIGGSVTVLGTVRDEAVAIGGSVTLEPGSVVRGDAVAIGGNVKVKEGATLRGDRVAIGGSFKGVVNTFTSIASGSVSWFMFSILGTFVRALVLFLLALMILTFMPNRSKRIGETLAARPGASTLGGVALAVGFIPFIVLLAITIIGILAIPFAFLALIALHVIGLTVFMTWLGDKIPLFEDKKSPVLAMSMGLVVLTAIDLIPIVGSLAVTAIAFVSAGAVLVSKLGEPEKPTPPSGQAPAPRSTTPSSTPPSSTEPASSGDPSSTSTPSTSSDSTPPTK